MRRTSGKLRTSRQVRADLQELLSNPSDPLYTVHQVAAACGVKHFTVTTYIEKGKLRALRVPGGSYRIRASDAAKLDLKHPFTEPPQPSAVYFVLAEVIGLVKIGASTRLKTRIRDLQNILPFDVSVSVIYHAEPYKLEFKLHKQFARLRQRQEWFTADADLRDYITHNATPFTHES